MDVQSVLIDFMRWITVGTGTVVGVIVIAGLCIPRRSTVSLPRHLDKKSALDSRFISTDVHTRRALAILDPLGEMAWSRSRPLHSQRQVRDPVGRHSR